MSLQESHRPCFAYLSIIALKEPDLEIIKTNILTKIHDNYINNEDNVGTRPDITILTAKVFRPK